MTVTSKTIARLDARWADSYGVGPGYWGTGRVDVAPRAGDADWAGLFVFARGDAALVQAPAALGAQAARWITGRPAGVLLDPSFWAGLLGPRFATAVGPAWLGYTDVAPDHPTDGVRLLGPEDADALRALEAYVGPTAWEHGGLAHGAPDTWGVYAGDALAAAGSIVTWPGRLGQIGIVAHPGYRGRGHATRVVARMAQAGLEADRLMQYRTLASNAPSMAIAAKLGFAPYATTLSVRLAAPDEELAR